MECAIWNFIVNNEALFEIKKNWPVRQYKYLIEKRNYQRISIYKAELVVL